MWGKKTSNWVHFHRAWLWVPQPIDGSWEDVSVIPTTHILFAVSALCSEFSLVNNLITFCLSKQFSRHKYSISKVVTQFQAESKTSLMSPMFINMSHGKECFVINLKSENQKKRKFWGLNLVIFSSHITQKWRGLQTSSCTSKLDFNKILKQAYLLYLY